MLSDIFNLQEENMKKKRLNKIIVILLAVLMLAAMLPVSAIAESYSAARDLRILNKAHQEVEKDLLAVDSEQYKAGKAPEETVAELIGMLESDPRIASVKRDSATTFTYKLHSGLTAVYDYNIIHGRPQGKLPEPSSLEQMLPKQIVDENAETASNNDVLVLAPYFGIAEEFSNYYINFGTILAAFTGGTLTVISGDNCTAEDLSEVVNHGIILFDSHGLESDGFSYLVFHNTAGVSANDYTAGRAVMIEGGGVGVNYQYFNNHVSGTMPDSYVHLATCSGGSDGHLLEAFIEHGASAAYGYDNTVTVAYDLYLMQDYVNTMRGAETNITDCYSIGQAMAYGISRRGEYDPYYYNSTGEYTRPVLKGNSNWYLPPLYSVTFRSPYDTATYGYSVTKGTVLSLDDFPYVPQTILYDTFSHWEGPNGRVTGDVTITANTQFIAVYTRPQFNVVWVNSVDGSIIANVPYDAGSSIPLSAFPTPPQMIGYAFDCWTFNGAAVTSPVTVLGETVFVANYVTVMNTIFFYDGVTNQAIDYIDIQEGQTIPLSAFPTPPAHYGYTFTGQWIDQNGNIVPETGYVVLGNGTLTAVYEQDEYIITFVTDAGTPAIGTITAHLGDFIPVSEFPAPPEINNYTFDHWELQPSGTTITDGFQVTGHMTICAVYTMNNFNASWVDGFTGETLVSISVEYGHAINLEEDFPTPPEHEGMVFSHWEMDGEVYDMEYWWVMGDTVITAVYVPAAAPIAGDVDGDGEVSSADALNTLRCALNIAALSDEQYAVADMDGDGIITISDALIILRLALLAD